MAGIDTPIIFSMKYSNQSMENIASDIEKAVKDNKEYLLDFPTVYIINEKEKNSQFSVYIGETSNIRQRTLQHLNADSKLRDDWKKLSQSNSAMMYVIGHSHFNKPLTLDIENRMMMYMSSVDKVHSIYNRRTNQQNKYYTSDELDEIFSKVWLKLRRENSELFPLERVIKDSAVFKASPFHKLKEEQVKAKDAIMLRIMEALNREKEGQLIFVCGEAGSGKTVLMSSLFYELTRLSKEEADHAVFKNMDCRLLVNHNQQLVVYQQIAEKLGMTTKQRPDAVSKPTSFINSHSPEDKVDVVLVDEAHLLLTQGKMSYRGKNHLQDLLERAKVVVAVFDQNQILTTGQLWENDELLELLHDAKHNHNLLELNNQLRLNSDPETVQWIRRLIDDSDIGNIPKDFKGYELKIFDSPQEMYERIQKKAQNQDSGISRMIATFDWEYVDKRKPDNGDDYWKVSIGEWSLPWNLQLSMTKEQKRKRKKLSWAEQEQTIGEVGSTFTVQGLDLNYAGVIIGTSVKYRDGKIIFDGTASKNKKATQKRTMRDGTKKSFAEILLRNELNVLLTRGVNGLYIYAVDDELQQALIKASRGEMQNER